MDSEERRFSGKVYTRRNRRIRKKDVSSATTGVASPETKVSKPISQTLDAEQPAKVVPQTQDLLIANSTSGDVPEGVVELREGSCGGEVAKNGGDGSQPDGNDEVANRVVKPVISRVEDRVRISLNESRSAPKVAAALKESRTGEMHSASSTHVEGERQADNASSSSSDSGSSSSDSDSDSSSPFRSDAGSRM